MIHQETCTYGSPIAGWNGGKGSMVLGIFIGLAAGIEKGADLFEKLFDFRRLIPISEESYGGS
jgi:hypothetical protein